ncbi:hypothetical protein SAMN05421878_10619 [Actinobaculum suis]|uniref:Uncharacterized protein n=1 Tax=Actinobaculum suis TaxID=1657 RepID=A0A1G7BWU4_9ACTO|nr:hypothetical protein SAMN05421878_10619 [Actinobaculum suis]
MPAEIELSACGTHSPRFTEESILRASCGKYFPRFVRKVFSTPAESFLRNWLERGRGEAHHQISLRAETHVSLGQTGATLGVVLIFPEPGGPALG